MTMAQTSARFGGRGRVATCPKEKSLVINREKGENLKKWGVLKQTKSASNISTPAAKQVLNVPDDMNVLTVVESAISSQLLKLPEFLRVEYWAERLPQVFSADEAESILKTLVNGVKIGRAPAQGQLESPNWPSAREYSTKVSEVIDNDLKLGRLYGPFDSPPFSDYVISPLGAFLKRDGVKVRVIHDLSYPHGKSVNAMIDPEEFSLHYASIDSAVEACHKFTYPYLSNIDLKDAYKHIGVSPEDWHLLGFRWALPGSGPCYYFSRVLSFGLRSAPALFDIYASALERFIVHSGITSEVVRYVDDFLLISESEVMANLDLDRTISISRQSGFLIQGDKVTRPVRSLEFLGIIIDLESNELRISEARVGEIKSLLAEWEGVTSASKRKLLRLIGKLGFAARVVRTGRAFLGRLIGLSKSVRALHHHVRLNSQARRDVDWWHSCINSHNGVSMIAIDWSVGTVLHVFTDASNAGMGAFHSREWFALLFTGSYEFALGYSINWRELFTAVKALATWAHEWAGQKVMFHVDNQAAVHILNKLYSPESDLMELVRAWALLLESNAISVTVVYIPTDKNVDADLISRVEYSKFLARHSPPPARIWPATIQFYDKPI